MSTKFTDEEDSLTKDNQFYEWLVGRGKFPYYQEEMEVPLPDGFYVCRDCGAITSYWEPGMLCGSCEATAERQIDEAQGN